MLFFPIFGYVWKMILAFPYGCWVLTPSLHQRRTRTRHCMSEFSSVSRSFWSFLFITFYVRSSWDCANHQTRKYWKDLPAPVRHCLRNNRSKKKSFKIWKWNLAKQFPKTVCWNKWKPHLQRVEIKLHFDLNCHCYHVKIW